MPVESQPQPKDKEVAIDAFAKVVWAAFLAERSQQHGLPAIPSEQGKSGSDAGLCQIPISTSQTDPAKVLSHAMPIQPP